MLHHQPTGELRSPSKSWRAILLTMLIASGLAVSGLRGPTREALAEETTAATNDAAVEKQTAGSSPSPRFDRSYLPANAVAVISLKPLKVADSTTVLEPVLSTFPFAANVAVAFSTAGNGVDEVKTIMLAKARDQGRSSASNDVTDTAVLQVFRMRKPYEAGKLREMIFGQAPDGATESTCMGYPCFTARSDSSGHLVNYLLVDDRTLVIVRERDVPTVLAADAQSHPSWYDSWLKIAESPLALACDSPTVAAMEDKPGETEDAQDRFIRSMLRETSFLFVHVDCVSGELRIIANARCVSPDKAIAVTKTLESGVAIFTTALNSAPRIFERSAMPKEFQSIDVAGSLLKTVSNLQLNRGENEVQAEVKFDAAFVTEIAEATKALTSRQSEELKVRDEQDQRAHAAKLGRLVKAFDTYRAEHGHYPAAAVVAPDGKTLHSWRVELLPYLGEKALFDEYKLNEPWDSEHNKRLIAKIPGVYATSQWSEKGNADYFVVSGAGTLFDPAAANDRKSADDSPSETILVLQSHQRVPWTKPLDIEITADHNPTHPFRFGKGFYAAFADGSVKFVSKETDATTVRALFTKAGGEEVKLR